MGLDIFAERGVPLDRQMPFTWAEYAGRTASKLDSDAFTRVRIILMNGIEQEANRFSHGLARLDGRFRGVLAQVRRVEHHQQTLVNWLLPADLTPIETTIAYEQVAIEVTAQLALGEPDPYLAQVHRFGLLEDFDHLYRFAALADRVFGIDANAITQCYTDIMPGRPTMLEHRAPEDDLRDHYDRAAAKPLSKLGALTILAGENQTRDYYMTVGPQFADAAARQLYAEIASIEEQHVTQYESIIDPRETPLEKWLLHEACEVWNYWSCARAESDPRVKRIWERFLDFELGHLHLARRIFEDAERRDAAQILPAVLPDPLDYRSHRDFLRGLAKSEVGLRARGARFVTDGRESEATAAYRERVNAEGSPSESVSLGWGWSPGGEIAAEAPVGAQGRQNKP